VADLGLKMTVFPTYVNLCSQRTSHSEKEGGPHTGKFWLCRQEATLSLFRQGCEPAWGRRIKRLKKSRTDSCKRTHYVSILLTHRPYSRGSKRKNETPHYLRLFEATLLGAIGLGRK